MAILVVAPRPVPAQEYKGTKKYIYAVLGFVVVAVPAYLAADDEDKGNFCDSKTCMAMLGGAVGALVGFVIGSEVDSKNERKMAAGPNLDYTYQNVPLDITPERIAYFPGGAAVSGVGGARVVYRDGSILARGSGVRGIEDIAVVSGLDVLVVSTYANLISFPLRGDSVQGEIIDETGGGTLEAFDDRLAVAGLDSLRLLQLRRDGRSIATRELAGIENINFITDMTYARYGRVTWMLFEDKLAAYNNSFERLGELQLPAGGRSVRADGSRLAVALGSSGVLVLDATDPTLPRVVLEYTGVRFAYTADLDGDRLFVAAGPEGVAVVDISGTEPRVLGVARDVKFASDVIPTGEDEMWILDREGRRVQIAEFTQGGGG
jgi:hypothetical protein